MTDKEVIYIPTYLCKYYPDTLYTKEAIEKCGIYFSPLDNFNDPFENVFSWKEINIPDSSWVRNDDTVLRTYETLLAQAKDHYLTDIQGILRKLGLACFTINPSNLLMWSHYTANHTGLCKIYHRDSDYDFFVHLMDKVTYSIVMPEVDLKETDITQDVLNSIWTKSSEWKYEQEFRKIVFDFGLYTYNPKALHTVIFGCRMETKSKLLYKELLLNSNPNVLLLEAQLNPREYKLDFFIYDTNKKIELIADVDFETNRNKTCIASSGKNCYCVNCAPSNIR